MSYKRFVVSLMVLGTGVLIYLTHTHLLTNWLNLEEVNQNKDAVQNKTSVDLREEPNKNPAEEKLEPFQKEPGMYHVAYPRNYKFIIDQQHICEQKKPFMVVIVPVPPNNMEVRNAIRKTWGGETFFGDKVVLVLFLLGSRSGTDEETLQDQLQKENQQYRDLLQSNFHDTYRNLTIKTMIMMEWLFTKCPQASYAIKVDADVLLNIKNLIGMLVNLKTLQRNYMTGLVWYQSSVIRDPSNKFYLPHDVFAKDTYPPYPLGMCYIFSTDLPEKFLQESKELEPIYIEDAYLGLCLERLGIVPTKPPNIDQFVVKPPQQYNRCYFSGLIAVMTESTDQLVTYWTDMNTSSAPC
ncbi:beta-1,3-galactosyltransferase 1-like [Triplophysa dalaica]|uniref:beta-1,3-galactosyltransferase 1-like n=1 Tax=Triplophysa dalaica TaxID=1582913 RepID=UPI0024DFD7B5|nr:beta-1,3-galactosyltransferase 1-like [Triplophysa dalaica]XP_056615581.1 beta-1,3-galactosyltransferase 1-like [Triplophysa dalaica]XP_056615582.1 beta-1,3-galactosyltransferase 1-like [Triplophysa dalaica]